MLKLRTKHRGSSGAGPVSRKPCAEYPGLAWVNMEQLAQPPHRCHPLFESGLSSLPTTSSSSRLAFTSDGERTNQKRCHASTVPDQSRSAFYTSKDGNQAEICGNVHAGGPISIALISVSLTVITDADGTAVGSAIVRYVFSAGFVSFRLQVAVRTSYARGLSSGQD